MLIKSFTVENYRSITKANELPLSNLTILIGPNNEGKSNLLRALVFTLSFIRNERNSYRGYSFRSKSRNARTYPYGRLSEMNYDIDRDFPRNLPRDDKSRSIFKVVLALTLNEKKKLSKIIGRKFYDDLVIQLTFQKGQPIFLYIRDTSDLKHKLGDYSDDIFQFIDQHLAVSYIPAIRDSNQTVEIIEDMIAEELSTLENDKRYNVLMNKLEKLQNPILTALSVNLTKSVSEFWPIVKSIHLDSKERIKRISRLPTSVQVDDGINTPLELKGDGLKSLMAISIIQHLTRQRAAKKNIILLIEEPESHLHPDAIHKLRDVIVDISSKNQVIISTHSPLLVNHSDVSRNLLVYKSQVSPAKYIAEIRDILGVKISDNLRSANLMILVEGSEDRKIIKKCIEEMSPKIKRSLEQGIISFDLLDGSSHLSQKIGMWQSALCDVHVFLDNDKESQNAFDNAEKDGLISTKNATLSLVNDFKESEIEDLIDVNTYDDEIVKKYGLSLRTSSEFRTNRYKWTIRTKKSFQSNSKRWNDRIEMEIKRLVADKIDEIGMKGINKHHQGPFKSLVKSIETYLETSPHSKL